MFALPVWLLRWAATIVMAVWILGLVAVGAMGWSVEAPFSTKIARGLLFAIAFLSAMVAGQVFRFTRGARPLPSRTDTLMFTVYLAANFCLLAAIWSGLPWDRPREGRALLLVGAVLLAAAGGLWIRERKRKKNEPAEIEAPIAHRTVATASGERTIKVGLPMPADDGYWVAWWSVAGLPAGYLVHPAFGPDSATALARALSAAETAATSTAGSGAPS
ncbi:hypothetical protein [Tsukamurella paurometabola]|uniref:hypothetical protein n=1 Tax=Tsukamurella paurometabola TaxID=2061 RepID=UPI00019F0ADC|nr:hypothetical protein [Tsukamurella paurometabola]